MPSFEFNPGRFAPVVEIILPDQVEDFTDGDGDCFFPLTDTAAFPNESIVMLEDLDPPANCFENVILESTFPVSDTPAGVRCAFNDDVVHTLHLSDFLACPCFLSHMRAAETSYAASNLDRLDNHLCVNCTVCKRLATYTGTVNLFVDMPGYDPRPLNVWSIPLVHPHFPRKVILVDKDYVLAHRQPDKYTKHMVHHSTSLMRPSALPSDDIWKDPRSLEAYPPDAHYHYVKPPANRTPSPLLLMEN